MSKKCNKIAKEYDVVVMGGGLAGMCAAIASARQGCKTALIQDRPVLGGNQSSEMRVGISGAVASGVNYARNAREGGILEEIWLENMYRNRVDYMHAYHMQDILFWEKVTQEPNLELFLNTSATHPVQDETGRILAVEAVQPSTEKEFLFSGKIFIDCSGDSRVAYEAGAEYRWGQEAKSEFNEGMAPEEAHNGVLCSSAVFYVKDMGKPVPFKAPECAYHFTDNELLPFRPHSLGTYARLNTPREEAFDWWIEYGGIRDTVGDNEDIRDELYKIALGVWDHMKNGGDHGFENYAISWITKLPAKRESRRLMGDYIVNENDVRGSTLFDDRVAYAGWPIDIHPPKGIFFNGPPCTQEMLDDIWSIPFRSLYSKNIPNLMMAGRNISVSRIALGSARVMATCAIEGEAVGTAAGLCIAHNATPRELGQNHIRQLQQTLLKNGAYIKDLPNDDPLDLARKAKVSSSPDAAFSLETSEDTYALETSVGQLVPITADRLDYVDLLLESSLSDGTELELRLVNVSRINEFPTSSDSVATATATVEPGRNWVRFQLNAATQKGLYWLVLPAAEGISWHQQKSKLPTGARSASYSANQNRWVHKPGHCLVRLFPESKPYGCENIINGVTRPEKWTNLWVAEESDSQYLELQWEQAQEINTLHLSLDTDFELNIYGAPEWGMVTAPNCVKDYTISYWQDGQWVALAQEQDNYQRRRVHTFPTISTTKIRLDFLASNSDVSAHVFEVRCYCE